VQHTTPCMKPRLTSAHSPTCARYAQDSLRDHLVLLVPSCGRILVLITFNVPSSCLVEVTYFIIVAASAGWD